MGMDAIRPDATRTAVEHPASPSRNESEGDPQGATDRGDGPAAALVNNEQ